MNFPFYVHIGGSRILLHSIIEPLAFFIGFRYLLFLKRNKGDILSSNNRFWIILAAIFGALLGSRLVGGLEDPTPLFNGKNWLIHFYTNKTVLGGLTGGLFAVETVKKLMGVKEASGDLFTFPIILALMIGRIGCFSMGVYEETYGLPTSWFMGMDLGDGINRHPVTIYEIIYLIILWITLRTLSHRVALANGALFKIFMMAYIIFRFFLDYLKPHYTYPIGLTAIQVTCLAGLFWYLPYLMHPKRLLKQQAELYA